MATKYEALKAKLAKLDAEKIELVAKLEAEELAVTKNEEFMVKSADVLLEASAILLQLFEAKGIQMPEGKSITFTQVVDESGVVGFIPAMADVATKREKREAGGGGGTRHSVGVPDGIPELVSLANKECSWSDIAGLLGIPDSGASKHSEVFHQHRAIHDQLIHEGCTYVAGQVISYPVK